ncbi:MAG: YajQ family cyclic di-GMP-binding protein [Candidatus Nitrospinota bacterium M3_3B_026]
MAKESSFDIVSKVDMQEVSNAINQAMAEIRQRYDFKGSKSEITLDQKAGTINILADDDLKLKSVVDILQSKLVRRGVALKALDYGPVEKATGGMARQVITLQQGIPTEKAKEIVKLIKNMKLKVQGAIQGDQVRVTGKKKDDLQAVIAALKEKDFGIDMQFINYR